jgi:glycosyltransferase involved in cell wall biosynthesis
MRVGNLLSDDRLVSCLCVTRNRAPLLRRAVSCFLNQTYQPRELVVVYEMDDPATRDLLGTFNEPSIRSVEVPALPKLTLGVLRNLSMEASRGYYVAQWDDDDWHGPARLAEQIGALRANRKPACVLSRWVMYDETTQSAFLSGPRAWEGSLVAERNAVPLYPDLPRGEDKCVIERMLSEDKLVGLDNPHLYVYIYHGANTWERSHWQKNLLPFAQPATPEATERVKSLLKLQCHKGLGD